FGIWLILPFVWRRLPVPSAGAVGALVVALLISGGHHVNAVLHHKGQQPGFGQGPFDRGHVGGGQRRF
ncbi:hypothetical protein, partial [Klebsiella pneumoniae]|uniref:hypothetical protein n=1 Tax=Klebsiella pneumoniae TaxID=573 RepID=UPI0038551EA1